MFRSPARIFAPLALVLAAVAVLLIVNANNGGGGAGSATTTSVPSTTTTTQASPKRHKKTYIVKNGDVLSAISIKTGVPLATIQQLNPNVDAQSLHAGQKIKLAP